MAEPSRQQAAADALRQLIHRGSSAAVKAALESEDPEVRRVAARRLLGGTPLDAAAAEQRKAAAAQALADHHATGLGRGPAKYAPEAAVDSITAATGLHVTHDSSGTIY